MIFNLKNYFGEYSILYKIFKKTISKLNNLFMEYIIVIGKNELM